MLFRSQPWHTHTLSKAQQTLAQEFTPISDMRASAQYRQRVLSQLLQRAWLSTQHRPLQRLEDVA